MSLIRPVVAVLCTQKNSFYELLPGVDCWDKARDAYLFKGGMGVIAHPPCAQWGRLRTFARDDLYEKGLAPWCVHKVQRWGGVLEHPAGSKLWNMEGLPLPGKGFDMHGGWSLSINQSWFGARVVKNTWLYIVGVSPRDIPAYPLSLDQSVYVVSSSRARGVKGEVSKWERSYTVPRLATWLFEVARTGFLNKCDFKPV